MTNSYNYQIFQCDVSDQKALHAFREKREQWCSWLEYDQDHAIWSVLSELVWQDTTFATISKLSLDNPECPLNTVLLGEKIISGHFAMQILALRRLADKRSDVISLPRLIKDLDRNWHLLTRENLVCFDGLPYDYKSVQNEIWANRRPGIYWGNNIGPRAYATSEHLHRLFDRLSGIEEVNRSRSDLLPKSLLATVNGWLSNSGVEEIVQWSHAYLAHGGDKKKRINLDHLQMTNNKISAAIRDVARVTEALSGEILGSSGRRHALMPIAQFDVFERLDKPVASEWQRNGVAEVWNTKSREWDLALEDVRHALLQRAAGSH